MKEIATILRILIYRARVRDVDVNRIDLVMTTATEAANMLVTELGIPFRLAHQVVASAASEFSRGGSNQANSWLDLALQKERAMIGNQSKKLKAGLPRALTVANVVTHKRSRESPAPRESHGLSYDRIHPITCSNQKCIPNLGRLRWITALTMVYRLPPPAALVLFKHSTVAFPLFVHPFLENFEVFIG